LAVISLENLQQAAAWAGLKEYHGMGNWNGFGHTPLTNIVVIMTLSHYQTETF
jgi:hypothetical protein